MSRKSSRKILMYMGVDRKLTIKAPLYLVGMIITCLGTAFINANALGSDAMNTFFCAIADRMGILVGNVYTIFNSIMLLVGFAFARRYMGIGSLLQILVQGVFLNIFTRLLGGAQWLFEGLTMKAVSGTIGLGCRLFGTALSTSMCLGTAGFEACLFSLADRIKIEYKHLKLISEVLFFISAMLLHGVFGINTVISVILYGAGISFFMVRLNRGALKKLGIDDERNNLARNARKVA